MSSELPRIEYTPTTIPPRPGWTRYVPMTPEGVPFIVTGLITLAFVLAIGPLRLFALLVAPLLLFTIWFYRDPERAVPADPRLVLSAADGRVTVVEDGPEGLRISVFLNVFDVHVNRSPVPGTVRGLEYKPGEFINAMRPIAEDVNERLHLTLDTPHGPVVVTQVAGLIARRIVCRARLGDRVEAGERYGMIRFGSCTVVRLPPGTAAALVKPGDRVTGGVTAIARWLADVAAERP